MILWILPPVKTHFWLYGTQKRRKHSARNCITMMKKRQSLEDITLQNKDICVCINIQRLITAFTMRYKDCIPKLHFLALTAPDKHILVALQWQSHLHVLIYIHSDFSPHIEYVFGITLQQNFPKHFASNFTPLCKPFNITVSAQHGPNYSLFKHFSQNYLSAMFTPFSHITHEPWLWSSCSRVLGFFWLTKGTKRLTSCKALILP